MPPVTVPSGDSARTGVCPGSGLTAEPKVVQRFTVPRPSLPAVTGGVLYAGDETGAVHAFDVATGDRLWRHAGGSEYEVDRMPAVTADLVVVESGERVWAHDRRDGRLRWDVDGGSPTAAGDLLLIMDNLNGFQALDLGSGGTRWRSGRRFDDLTYGLLETHPTVAGELVLVTEGFEGNHTHGGLHAYDRSTGTLLWGIGERREACTRPSPCPEPDELTIGPFHAVVAHGLVWTIDLRMHQDNGGCELTGVDPRNGEQRRALSAADADGSPVFGPELAYCRAGGRVDALDPAGTVRWSRDLMEPIVGTPLLAGGVLHLATEGGGLHALDAGTGDVAWQLTLDEPTEWSAEFIGEYNETETPFTIADGAIFARSDDAVLVLR